VSNTHNPPCKRFCGFCMGIANERSAVVKYLHEHLARYEASLRSAENQEGRALLKLLAETIESGEHRR
jgi:hypothetical protein